MGAKRRIGARGRFESLEAKQMLAGDVTVAVVGGSLNIVGDELGNQVALTSGETPGSYVIRGLDGTRVTLAGAEAPPAAEGDPPATLVVEGVHRNVRIAMGDGDDTVVIDDAAFRGSMRVALGEGADRLAIGVSPDRPDGPPVEPPITDEAPPAEPPSVVIRGGLTVAAGAGDDTVVANDASIGRHLAIASGDGADEVRLGQRLAAPPSADADAPSTEEPNRLGPGLRVGGGAVVNLGAGEDTFVAASVGSRFLRVNGGVDADEIRLQRVRAQAISLFAGPGEAGDTVGVEDSRARRMTLRSGAGDDTVRVVDSAFGLLAVGLGAGDDTLGVNGLRARAALLLGGEGDFDELRLGDKLEVARQVIRGFEVRPEGSADDARAATETS